MSYPAYTTAECPTCRTLFRGKLDRCEDGPVELPGQRCADPTCETWICAGQCEAHFSFACDGCGQRFCDAHKQEIPDVPRPLRLCVGCAAEMALQDLEELEPECTCQFSGDWADAADCDLHNPASPWNLRLRALQATVESYELGGVA